MLATRYLSARATRKAASEAAAKARKEHWYFLTKKSRYCIVAEMGMSENNDLINLMER